MSSPVVQVAEGKLRGCTKKNYNGEDILAFLGVPFARPPIGNLRFKVIYFPFLFAYLDLPLNFSVTIYPVIPVCQITGVINFCKTKFY